MGQLTLQLCDMAGNALPQEWAIEDVRSATVMMEELDRFSPHTVTVTGSFRRNLALLDGLATVKIVDGDIGVIAWGLLDNPEQQITAADEHTITLQLPNITEQLRYETTGQGWQAGGVDEPLSLRAMIRRIGALKYGWSADVLDYGDTPFILRYEDATLLGALTDAASATFGHIRQGRDATGAPSRAMEIGYFGAAPTVALISPDGGGANAIVTGNPDARLVETITRHPADCTKLANVVTPLGGGQGDSQVRLRHLFRILYDPTYDHFAGGDPALMALYFPEYDGNYPIPALFDAGLGKWLPARPMKGDSNRWEPAVRLDIAAGGYEYCVVHQASLAAYNARYPHEGAFRAQFADSTFSYVSNPTLLNQELTERGMYAAAVAHLRWYGTPQRTVTVTTVGNRRPPRAGEQVAFNYRRVGADLRGTFAELDEGGAYTIVAVQRTYDTSGAARDTWTVTNNGKGPPDTAPISGDQARQLIQAERMIPVTSAAPAVIGPIKENLDPQHPMVVPVRIPSRVYRVSEASLDVEFMFHRADVALDGAGPIRNDGGVLDPNGQTHSLPLSGGQSATLGIQGIPSGNVVNQNTSTPNGTTSTNSIPANLAVWQPIALDATYGQVNLDANGNGPGAVHYTTAPIALVNAGTYGGMVSIVPGRNANASSDPISGYDAAGNRVQAGTFSQRYLGSVNYTGSSGVGVLLNTATPWTASDGSGLRTNAGAPGTTLTDLTHYHFLQVSSGKNQPAGLVFVPQGDESFLGTTSGDTGRFHTNSYEAKAGGNPNHSHTTDLTNLGIGHNHATSHEHPQSGAGFNGAITAAMQHTHDITHAHDISHSHDISHYHNIAHAHDLQHVHAIDHTHDMRHYHDIAHTHQYDHYHYFPHTHVMNAGIFETSKPARVQLWIDSGDGSFVDRSPDLGGPWTDSFSLIDISPYVNSPGKKVRLQFISVDTGAAGLGLGGLSVSGTWVWETSSATGTIFAG